MARLSYTVDAMSGKWTWPAGPIDRSRTTCSKPDTCTYSYENRTCAWEGEARTHKKCHNGHLKIAP